MSSKGTSQPPREADSAAVAAAPHDMAAAWNWGSGDAFAAPFRERADFIAFEGTHLGGREEIASFHRALFDTAVKGTRIDAAVSFVRFLRHDVAVMHASARVTLAGAAAPTPSRDSMQLFVATKDGGEWRVDAMLNARQLTVERQLFLDDFDALPPPARERVLALVAALKGGSV